MYDWPVSQIQYLEVVHLCWEYTSENVLRIYQASSWKSLDQSSDHRCQEEYKPSWCGNYLLVGLVHLANSIKKKKKKKEDALSMRYTYNQKHSYAL